MKTIVAKSKPMRFRMGRLAITPNAKDQLLPVEVADALCRHAEGDWGDVCEEDRQSNEEALHTNLRLFSVYHSSKERKFWVITEADRSATTILMPEDY